MTPPKSPTAQFLKAFAYGCALTLVAVAGLNGVVDPFRVYHAAWWDTPYPRDPRMLVPGLIRHSEYDAVIAGTSHCDNFLPSTVKATLGWEALRITLPGSHFPQQEVAVRAALETGRVRHVLWGLDCYAFYAPPDSVEHDPQFPLEMYRPHLRRPFNYLLNLETAQHSLRTLAGRGDSDLDTRGTWFTKFQFSEAACLDHSGKQLPRTIYDHRRRLKQGWSGIAANINEHLATLVAEHPEVEFVFVLPPISALGYLPELDNQEAGFEHRLQFRELLVSQLSQRSNVRLYDFEIAVEITHDLSRYMDLTHYDLAANDWMLRQIAADHYRLTPDNFAAHQRQFATATRRFVAPILAGTHHYSTALGWNDLHTPRPPTRIVSSIGAAQH